MEERTVEWQPRSGVRASYSRAEEDLLRGFVAAYEDGRITEEQAIREIGVLHDLKVMLGARLVGDTAPAESAPENPPDQLAMTG